MSGQPENPAVLPEPEERTERTYKVTGPHDVLGHEPGEQFVALIPEQQEARLVSAGHIKPVADRKRNQTQEG